METTNPLLGFKLTVDQLPVRPATRCTKYGFLLYLNHLSPINLHYLFGTFFVDSLRYAGL